MTHLQSTYAKAQNRIALDTILTMCSDHELRVWRFEGQPLVIIEGWEFNQRTMTLDGYAPNGDEYRIHAENIREVEVQS